MSRSIFISYRRSDSEGEAGRLSDVLSHRFTEQAVFMDVDAIQPGRDFRKAIEESIQNCAVLLTMIGPEWLEAKNTRGERRLDEVNDYVRLEIGAALRRDIPVIPVLVRGAKMPQADELPTDVSDLAYRNGVELTHARWKSDLQVLVRALEPYMAAEAAVQPPEPVPRAVHAPSRPPVAPPTPISRAVSVPTATGRPSSVPLSRGVVERSVPLPVQAPAAASLSLPSGAVEKVTKQLAQYIGPIAEFVVKRAAKSCGSVPALCAKVSEEIESPADRKDFMTRCEH